MAKFRVIGKFGIFFQYEGKLREEYPVDQIVSANGFFQAKDIVFAEIKEKFQEKYGRKVRVSKRSDISISIQDG